MLINITYPFLGRGRWLIYWLWQFSTRSEQSVNKPSHCNLTKSLLTSLPGPLIKDARLGPMLGQIGTIWKQILEFCKKWVYYKQSLLKKIRYYFGSSQNIQKISQICPIEFEYDHILVQNLTRVRPDISAQITAAIAVTCGGGGRGCIKTSIKSNGIFRRTSRNGEILKHIEITLLNITTNKAITRLH